MNPQTTTTTAGRLHGLDFLRALMMSLGLVLHSAQIYLTNPAVDYYWDPARSLSMDVLLFFINTFRMPVFYLLSGFFTVLILEKRGFQAMLKNRYSRIVVPFVLFLPVLALSMTLLRIVSHHVMHTGEFGFDLGLVENTRGLWDNTHNLWFLYYLMFYLATVSLLFWLWGKLYSNVQLKIRAWAEASPIYSAPIFLPLCVCLAVLGSSSWAGRISANLSFIPALDVYLYFGLCFAMGWLLYLRLSDLAVLGERWKKNMAVATVMFIVALVTILLKGDPGTLKYSVLHAVLSLSTGISMGYYMLAFVGLFSRHCQGYSPWVRYFSDGAYWIFIFHSIPLVITALALRSWVVPAEAKFTVVCSVTLVVCLLTYQWFVRNGRIGELLNGRRYESVPWRQ